MRSERGEDVEKKSSSLRSLLRHFGEGHHVVLPHYFGEKALSGMARIGERNFSGLGALM